MAGARWGKGGAIDEGTGHRRPDREGLCKDWLSLCMRWELCFQQATQQRTNLGSGAGDQFPSGGPSRGGVPVSPGFNI